MNSISLLLMSSTVYAVSIDCPKVIQFADSLGIRTAQPAIWTSLNVDCCAAGSITCVGPLVTEIDWTSMGLTGIINGAAIPSSVTGLFLHDNAITGNIPNGLPSGLTHLDLDGNQLTGDLPSFPSTLQYIWLGYPGTPGNHFTGTLRVNRPIQLYINYNWITDVVVQISSDIEPGSCELSNNPLLGNPNIVGLTMCLKDGLYSAGLLPVTRSTLTTVVRTTKGIQGTTSIKTTKYGHTTISELRTTAVTTATFTTTNSAKRSSKIVDETTELAATTASTATVTTSEVTTSDGTKIVEGHTTTKMTSMMANLNVTIIASLELTIIDSLELTSTVVGTVQFVHEISGFATSLFMAVRVLTSWILLTVVITRTPFIREFKRAIIKGKTGQGQEL